VETAYAKQNRLTTLKMVNKDGKTVAAVPEAIMAAAAGADWEHAPGFYVILTDSPGAQAWPIAGSTFILVPTQPKDIAAARPERVPTQRGRRVVDVALEGGPIPIGQQGERGRVLQRLRLRDAAFRHLTRGAAIAVLIILGGIIVSLVHGSWLALSTFGFNFLISDAWNAVTEK